MTKGVADDTGATAKRLCGDTVLTGFDLSNASSVCSIIKDLSKTKIYEISSEFNGTGIYLPGKRTPFLSDNMEVHQVVSYTRGKIYTHNVSCYYNDSNCQCFNRVKRNVLSALGSHFEAMEVSE